MDAMNSKGSVKRRMADLLRKIGELYRSIQTRLHAILLQISMIVPLVEKITDMERSPCRIALAQKRVVNRFYYPCKFALFRRCSADRFQGIWSTTAQDPSIASL